jgi:hypothetical protein
MQAKLGAGRISICLGGANLASQRPQVVADKIKRTEERQARRGRRGKIRVAQTYDSHEAWLADWRRARGSELYCTGNASATGGNSMIIVADKGDVTFSLTVKLPTGLQVKHGRALSFIIPFRHGADEVRGALDRNALVMAENERCKKLGGKRRMRERGEVVHEIKGGSLAWRIKMVEGKWYASVTVSTRSATISRAPSVSISTTDFWRSPKSAVRATRPGGASPGSTSRPTVAPPISAATP